MRYADQRFTIAEQELKTKAPAVPLFSENRIRELQLANENFKDDLEGLVEAASHDKHRSAGGDRID